MANEDVSVDKNAVDDWVKELPSLLQEYDEKDIFNADVIENIVSDEEKTKKACCVEVF